MTIKQLKTDEHHVTLVWDDGEADSYHYVWLRDHLQSPDFFDAVTGERLVDAHGIDLAVRPLSMEIDEGGDLSVTWPDQPAPQRYAARWLRHNAYSEAARRRREEVLPAAEPWPFADAAQAPSFDYAAAVEAPETGLAFLRAFRRYGFAFLRDAPAEPGVAAAMTERMGYLRQVAFGAVREIRNDPTVADNVAFTEKIVPPHTDATNYHWPYDVQFLHCIANDAPGGDSWLVDGFAAAEALRAEDPEAFAVLASTAIDYRIGARGHDVRVKAPLFELDGGGALRLLRFANQQRRVLSVPFDRVEPFYAAYHRFSAMVNDPGRQLSFRFAPGDVLMFNNHRILHARAAFDSTGGNRHLQLASTDMDMVDSQIRILTRKAGGSNDWTSLCPLEADFVTGV